MLNILGVQPTNTKVKFNAVLDASFSDDGDEPVTKDEVKAFCKLTTGTAEDDLLDMMIAAARRQCEDYAGLSLVERKITATLTNLNGNIYLPYGPVMEVSKVYDSSGAELTTADYKLSGVEFLQLVTPTQERLKVEYTAGYGSTTWALPGELKIAVLQQVFYLYNTRGETAQASRSGTVVELTLSPQARATLTRLKR